MRYLVKTIFRSNRSDFDRVKQYVVARLSAHIGLIPAVLLLGQLVCMPVWKKETKFPTRHAIHLEISGLLVTDNAAIALTTDLLVLTVDPKENATIPGRQVPRRF